MPIKTIVTLSRKIAIGVILRLNFYFTICYKKKQTISKFDKYFKKIHVWLNDEITLVKVTLTWK